MNAPTQPGGGLSAPHPLRVQKGEKRRAVEKGGGFTWTTRPPALAIISRASAWSRLHPRDVLPIVPHTVPYTPFSILNRIPATAINTGAGTLENRIKFRFSFSHTFIYSDTFCRPSIVTYVK